MAKFGKIRVFRKVQYEYLKKGNFTEFLTELKFDETTKKMESAFILATIQ